MCRCQPHLFTTWFRKRSMNSVVLTELQSTALCVWLVTSEKWQKEERKTTTTNYLNHHQSKLALRRLLIKYTFPGKWFLQFPAFITHSSDFGSRVGRRKQATNNLSSWKFALLCWLMDFWDYLFQSLFSRYDNYQHSFSSDFLLRQVLSLVKVDLGRDARV